MLFDFADLGPNDCYKLMVSTIVPRPIAWVVSQDAQGRMNAAPYSFFNAMSGDPPLVIIGVGGRGEGVQKDTSANIRAVGQFVVNLVSEETAQAMNVTAIEFEHGVDELAEAGLTTLPSTKVAPPRIAESPVAFECEQFMITDIFPDRALVMGRVVAMHVRDDCVLDAERQYIDTPKLNLIGRMHGRGWYARTTDRFDMPRIRLSDWKREP